MGEALHILRIVGGGLNAPTDVVGRLLAPLTFVQEARASGSVVDVTVRAESRRDAEDLVLGVMYCDVAASVRRHFESASGRIRVEHLNA